MDNSRIKDVCAEVTCIHTSGLRKVAVVALGHTAIGESERPIEQDRVSGENETALRDLGLGVGEYRYPLDTAQVTDQLNPHCSWGTSNHPQKITGLSKIPRSSRCHWLSANHCTSGHSKNFEKHVQH